MLDESVDMLPAALRPREFKVGDRVRVRLSAECDYCQEPKEDGLTGTVFGVSGARDFVHPENRTHPYWVRLDAVVNMSSISHFAASELEPVT